MRTFGRVLCGLGLGAALVGGAGALMALPGPVLQDAGGYIEEKRQALRAYLPDMPAMSEVITGAADPAECDGPADASITPAGAGADCVGAGEAPEAEDGAEAPKMLQRSAEAAARFRAPAGTR